MGSLVLAFAALLVATCLTVWAKIAAKRRLGLPLVACEPHRRAVWNLVDLLLVVLCYLSTNIAIFLALRGAATWGAATWSAGEPQALRDAVSALVSAALTNLLTMGLAIVWIRGRYGASWADLGFRCDKWASDVRLGLAAFAAASVPVYALQALLSQFVGKQHPIIEVLQQFREPWLLALSGISAVIVAPAAEEFFFRVLLQGWFESLAAPVALTQDRFSTGATSASPPPASGPADPENPYSPAPSTAESPVAGVQPTDGAQALPPATEHSLLGLRWDRAAIVFSSATFALVHVGHGAAPIPLFFLALALGYLYQRTGRLLPSVIVHFCLNACSLGLLYLGLAAGAK